MGAAAAGAPPGGGAARRGVRRRALAGSQGRRLLRLRLPPVAGRRRGRRAAACGVRQDHLPVLAQAGENGSCAWASVLSYPSIGRGRCFRSVRVVVVCRR